MKQNDGEYKKEERGRSIKSHKSSESNFFLLNSLYKGKYISIDFIATPDFQQLHTP